MERVFLRFARGNLVFNLGSDDEYFVSKSQSDQDQGIGRPAPRGGVMGDAFDLYKFYEHGNNEAQAIAALKASLYGDASSGCFYRDAYNDPETGEYVPAGLHPDPNRTPAKPACRASPCSRIASLGRRRKVRPQ